MDSALSASDSLRVYGKEMHRCLSFADLTRTVTAAPAATDNSDSEEGNSATTSAVRNLSRLFNFSDLCSSMTAV